MQYAYKVITSSHQDKLASAISINEYVNQYVCKVISLTFIQEQATSGSLDQVTTCVKVI